MDVNVDNLISECLKTIDETIKGLKKLNIIIAGKTGVGKSTLINSVFRENLAETGIGAPVTLHMRKISKRDFPLTIYDTKGIELGADEQKEAKDEIMNTIRTQLATKDINEVIHCIWYCINTMSNRIEPKELEWLKEFAEESADTKVPVIVVLTQAISEANAEEMRSYIENENLHICQVVPVLATDYEIGGLKIPAYGLGTLIQVMREALSEELHVTLQNVQKVALQEKRREARKIVDKAVAEATGAAAVPLPFSDCMALVPIQVVMIAKITAVYGIEVNRDIITAYISAAFGVGGVTVAGRTIVTNLLKLIPGVGPVAGGTISGVTAGILTKGLGEGYIRLMEVLYKGELKASDLTTDLGKAKMKELIKDSMNSIG